MGGNPDQYDGFRLSLRDQEIQTLCESLIDFNDALYFYLSQDTYGIFSHSTDFRFEF